MFIAMHHILICESYSILISRPRFLFLFFFWKIEKPSYICICLLRKMFFQLKKGE